MRTGPSVEKKDIWVSDDELNALLSHHEVHETNLEGIRPRIFKRITLILFFAIVDFFLVTYYPEYYLVTIFNELFVDVQTLQYMVQIRLTGAFCGGIIYLYLFYKNIYFKTANIVGIMGVISVTLSDFEMHFLFSSDSLTYPFLVVLVLRLVPLALLIQNHLDLR